MILVNLIVYYHTFLWFDYETFGINVSSDRPAQFAAVRTNLALQEIGQPLVLYCKPPPDFLPNPRSCLITGITPQMCLERGVPEYEFAKKIHLEMSIPGTIGVGYNNVRFDNEVTRFMFWRNLIDPYSHEWKNNCGYWDLLDVVRATYALRPEGIQWPLKMDGAPSFKLEDLTHANNIEHKVSHDALSDVRATISIARLILHKKPRLFNFFLSLRTKKSVVHEIDLLRKKPFLYISGTLPAKQGCLAPMWPFCVHPINKNKIIAWNLLYNPQDFLDLFNRSKHSFNSNLYFPIKTIGLNKVPIVVSNLKTLSISRAMELNINMFIALKNARIASNLHGLVPKLHEMFQTSQKVLRDVDEDLYSKFITQKDRFLLMKLRFLSAHELANIKVNFNDIRLEELFFRYRARNFPESLSSEELQRWKKYLIAYFFSNQNTELNKLSVWLQSINRLLNTTDASNRQILIMIFNYVTHILYKNSIL